MEKIQKKLGLVVGVLVVITIFGISIGYSFFNTNLSVADISANVRIEKDIRITGVRVESLEGNATSTYEDYNVSNITSHVYMPNSSSSVTYCVTVTNFGNVEYGILNISGLPSNLSYSIRDYTLQDKICDSTGKCKLGAVKEFYVTIYYNNYNRRQVEYDLKLDFDFREFERVTYDGVEATNLPSEVLNGSDFTVDLTNQYSYLSVMVSGAAVTGTRYNYVGGVLTVYNVDGPLYISTVRSIKNVIIGDREIMDEPEQYTSAETTNGYLVKAEELNGNYTYYYRGVINDNYVRFAGKIWRITRIDSNGNIRLVLDSIATQSKFSNDYTSGSLPSVDDASNILDYRQSTLKSNVESWYNKNVDKHKDSQYVVDSIFCVDTSHGELQSAASSGQNNVYYYTPYLHIGVDGNSYVPDFTCAPENILTAKVGVLRAEEVFAAGAFWLSANDKYYLYNSSSWSTLSASYYDVDIKQAGIIFVEGTGALNDWVNGTTPSASLGVRPVITVTGSATVSGTGTQNDPYVIQG